MKRTLGYLLGSLVLVMSGCKDVNYNGGNVNLESTAKSNSSTWVVTVGMEYSRFAGACPGAGYDAERMTKLFRQYTDNVKAFSSETATKSAVRQAMIEAADNAELFIFFYSGHGGQQRFWDTGAEETDGMDEFLCFYDTYMRDNEVWSILSRCKGRVMMINDCCHSCTMFRNPKPITLKGAMPLSVTHYESGNINLLVWSGCPDNTYSYGSATGGKMTNTLLKYFNSSLSYDSIWDKIENDSSLKQYEIVQRTIIGKGFAEKQIFK